MSAGKRRHCKIFSAGLGSLLLLFTLALAIAAPAGAAPAPEWKVSISAQGGRFTPGSSGNASEGPAYLIEAINSGTAPTSGSYEITDTLPSRLTPLSPIEGEDDLGNPLSCQVLSQTVSCEGTAALAPGEAAHVHIPLAVEDGEAQTIEDKATVSGGGTADATATNYTLLSDSGGPAWKLGITPLPTSFRPGTEEAEVFLYAANVGGSPTDGPFTITDTLPSGIAPTAVFSLDNDPATIEPSCEISGQTVSCEARGQLRNGHHLEVQVEVKVSGALAEGTSLANEMEISGGGALPQTAQGTLKIESANPPFDILPGFEALPLNDEGGEVSLAGSHPYSLDLSFGFPVERHPGGQLIADGHLRNAIANLPRGELGDPAATPVRCTEAELVTEPGCPAASAIGALTVKTTSITVEATTFPIYNMVPPPGQAAELGMNALSLGIFVHIDGSVRSDSDYGITGKTPDILALSVHPIWDATAELWGDPSSPAHDAARGSCSEGLNQFPNCPLASKGKTAFLTMPGDCPHTPLLTEIQADSWEEPSPPAAPKSARFEGAQIEDCGALEYKPSLEARPSTDQPDAPSGLDVTLHQPQDFGLGRQATAALKDFTLTLPEGLLANPAQGDGLAACSSGEIGLNTPVGQSPAHFSKVPQSCPAASKLGTLEVASPLLAEYEADGTVPVLDPQTGEPIARPLRGAIYLAKPFANPFGSLLAVYLAIEDEQAGIVAKLAGKVEPDPVTGQLTTRLEENPELPLQDARVHLFTGSRAALRTPTACGTYTSHAQLVPWSSPEAPAVSAQDSFAISGGACPPSPPHNPSFVAGTLHPTAGAYSPFALRLSREDASQPLAGFEVTLPPGLSAKLAGVPYCTEAEIAAAKAREHPEEGASEQAHPSCPAASEIGTLDAAAGAGPAPLHTGGHLYLAGPYKGAPLSVVAITPAIAGPFDLGAVVIRSALYIDPATGQGRALADPLPQILDGIPLDVRSVSLNIDRPQFTLNPTSCEPKTVLGTATSALGHSAALQSPFQVGGCSSLPYKPRLSARLFGPTNRGAHPRLRAIFQAKPGEANTARIAFALPHSEFIDQSHVRTICTRVQFAADQCPAGSIYGQMKAITPLLDYPLEGPLYLRSSSHELPDVVADLHGPPSQPIEVELDGRVDSVNGGIRTTFETVPDAPVTKAIVTTQGASKGLFQNSTNICKGTHRASLDLLGQNGKIYEASPVLKASCGKKARRHKHRHRR